LRAAGKEREKGSYEPERKRKYGEVVCQSPNRFTDLRRGTATLTTGGKGIGNNGGDKDQKCEEN